MKPHEELTDQELDELAREVFNIPRYNKDSYGITQEFKPTHPDSNQCERYLFPKLWKDCSISINYNCHEISITLPCGFVVYELTDVEHGDFNRIKVIAALKAMEKLGGGE